MKNYNSEGCIEEITTF